MAYRDVPGDMEVDYLGEEDNLDLTINQMDAQINESLPICEVLEEGELGVLESEDTDEPDLDRVVAADSKGYLSLRGIPPNFLRVRLDGQTRALLSGHHLYEDFIQKKNLFVANAMEVARLKKTADRIPSICYDITKHPYILEPLFMVGPNRKLEDVTHILYEDVPLGTLNRAVEQKDFFAAVEPIEDTIVLQLAFQLAKALRYCHKELMILHRNINPKSIFVFQDSNGRFYLKLGGFVFARRISKEDALSANPNKMFRFTAPEALEDNSDYDIAFYNYSSDVWSFGMVIDFIAHSGRNPFPGLKKRQLKEALLASPHPLRPALRRDLHPDLVELIKTCLRAEIREENGQIGPFHPTADQICAFFEEKGYTE